MEQVLEMPLQRDLSAQLYPSVHFKTSFGVLGLPSFLSSRCNIWSFGDPQLPVYVKGGLSQIWPGARLVLAGPDTPGDRPPDQGQDPSPGLPGVHRSSEQHG